jgi:DNA-binding CsgD family transcriptional regulator
VAAVFALDPAAVALLLEAGFAPVSQPPRVSELLHRAENCLAAAAANLGHSQLLAATLHEELDLVRTIRASLDGLEPGHPQVQRDVWAPLAPNERNYAARVAAGMTTAEIARELRVTHRAANRAIRAILDKLGLDNRMRLAAWVLSDSKRRALAGTQTAHLARNRRPTARA